MPSQQYVRTDSVEVSAKRQTHRQLQHKTTKKFYYALHGSKLCERRNNHMDRGGGTGLAFAGPINPFSHRKLKICGVLSPVGTGSSVALETLCGTPTNLDLMRRYQAQPGRP